MKKVFLIFTAFLICNILAAQKENIQSQQQGLNVSNSTLWPDRACNVCWENPSASDATERGWVQDAVASTWEKESNIRFTGWGTCNAESRGIRIRIIDVRPNCKKLGTGIDGLENGMDLNFTFNMWSSDFCSPKREFCIRTIAVHEFGHAMGFAHEQNRTDAPLDCQLDAQGTNGDLWVTPYDAESIMNYCNPKWSNSGFLSDRDKQGARLLYGGLIIDVPLIYALDKQKSLLWYNHTGYWAGTFDWTSNSGAKVGASWNFEQVFNDGEGFFYAIKENGELLWFNHNGYREGSFKWGGASGKVVGTGWNSDVQAAFAAGKGVIYLVKKNGDLLWYKHLGYNDGSNSWDPKSGTKIGNGWTDFYAVFSGGKGIIYRVAKNGDLFWYNHSGYATGANTWIGGNTTKVGNGWNSPKQIFSTGWGKIYTIGTDGNLRYYNHIGHLNGTASWGNGTGSVVGYKWSELNVIGLGSINPPKLVNLTDFISDKNKDPIRKTKL